MSYPMDIDECAEDRLQAELDRRAADRAAGKCDYCHGIAGQPNGFYSEDDAAKRNVIAGSPYYCRFADRHNDPRAINGPALARAERNAPDPKPGPLTFIEVLTANVERSLVWHGDDSEPWSGADWGNAMGGECGEAQNVVKKLRRLETGVQGSVDPDRDRLVRNLGDECADTFLYMGLLAFHYDVDLPGAIIRKFNSISAREGLHEHKLAER